MTRTWSSAVVATMCVAAACHQPPAAAPAPRLAGGAPAVDTAAATRHRTDSLSRLALRRDSIAMVAHVDSINTREDSLRTKVRIARATLFAAVHFDTNGSDIRAADRTTLDRKAALMVKNPSLRLRVFGYSNDRGSVDDARKLGMSRAVAVRDYLVAHGVDSTHVSIVSNGDARLLCRGSEEPCRARNRRDEFSILAGGGEIIPQ